MRCSVNKADRFMTLRLGTAIVASTACFLTREAARATQAAQNGASDYQSASTEMKRLSDDFFNTGSAEKIII